jgi:small-conductance mechanosensitive channel
MNHSALRTLALLLLLSPPAPAVAAGQSPVPTQVAPPDQEAGAEQAAEGPEAGPEALRPIEEGEIPLRAEHVEADLRRIEQLVEPTSEILRIEAAFTAREVEIVRLRAALDMVDPMQISSRRLEELRLPWLQLEGELTAWSSAVQRRFDTLQEERERLRAARALWELTAAAADAAGANPEVLQRTDAVLAQVVDVEARVRERGNAVGALAGRITSELELVSDSLDRIDAVAEVLRGRLLGRDAPPLWRSFDAADERLTGELRGTGREWARALFAYMLLRLERALFLVVLFIGLLVATTQLRRRDRGWSSEDDSEVFHKLVARPYAVALAFALVTSRLILPDPVGAAADVLTLLTVVPALRLGSVVLPSRARPALYGIAALTVLGRVAAVGLDASLGTRLLVLMVAAVGLLGSGLAAARVRARARQEGGWARVAYLLLSATVVLLAVAVSANIFGWVQLAKMLTDATIASLFAALAWTIVVAAVTVLLPPVVRGPAGNALPSLRQNETAVAAITIRTFSVVAALAWLQSTLDRFELWQPLQASATWIAASELDIGNLSISTGGLIGALLVVFGTWLIARFVRFVLQEELLPRLRLHRGDSQSLVTLVNYAVYGLGIMMGASAMGLTGTQLAVVFGALSLGIGFGLQTIVNNFVSGLILIFERPIKVGDTVQTVDHFGKVQNIGIRASTIRSFDGAEIIIPNGDLVAKEVINWTRTDEIRRAEVLVGVAYGTDPDAVLEILLHVAREHPKVREQPETKAQMIRFGDSSLDFRLRCWTLIDDWIDVVSDLHVAVNRALKEAGVTIPFPQRDLHLIPPRGEGSPDLPQALDSTDHPPPPDPEDKSE